MIKIAIIGATGYTGAELVRLLHYHPEVSVEVITSESKAGASLTSIHPQFEGIVAYELQSATTITNYELDAVFLALPHGVSMEYVEKFAGSPFKIIDLSGDFRLSAPPVYEKWYTKKHSFPEGFGQAVYGLPELHKAAISASKLVANPGCYPTSAILGLAPLVKAGLILEDEIIIDSKSGVTGAGIKPKPTTHFSSINDNFKSYGLKTHRHTIEIEEQLGGLIEKNFNLQFTPHLLPVDRGILSTIYTKPQEIINDNALQDAYRSFYQKAPFVRVRSHPPSIKEVRGTNYCDIFATYDQRTHRIITISVIDNLVKGAAGQAIQNLNLLFGLEETIGLGAIPMNP